VHAIGSLSEWRPEQRFDAIINLAGEPIVDARWTRQRKQRLWASRVTLTEELVARIAAAKQKPAVLLSGSAIGYYGDCGALRLDETAPAGSDFGALLCAAWENAAMRATESGVRVCVLRTGLVLSAGGGLLAKMRLPFSLGLGARLGNGQQWMSWIHIDDYVALVQRLLQANVSGSVNMTAPEPVTNATFTASLAGALHRPALLCAPASILKLAMGERSVLLLGGQRVLPLKAESIGFDFRHKTLEQALHSEFGG
jgi:uncharacterized protein (TIGR01777 family)